MKTRLALIIAFVTLLVSCSNSESNKNSGRIYTVKKEVFHKVLHFTGTIQPLRESALSSPVDAVVETMHAHYGQQVKKGDAVFTLNSSELQKQYNDTLTDYLKAKDNYTVAQAKFTGTQELWEAGLLSKNNFLGEQSSLATARVGLIQATRKLTEMLEKMDETNTSSLSALTIAEFDKIRQELAGKHNLIRLKAPSDGVLLYPPKSSGEEKAGKLNIGSTVKTGQVLALIGDLTGVSVEIDVPETDIDKIHTGMKATITGIALGQQVLNGELVAVNVQASNSANGTLPSFNAVVEVKNLNDDQRSWIKVGMSAAIEIVIDNDKQLLVPITAIKQERGNSVVKLKEENGSLRTHIVTTGAAQADKVVIASGLKPGDVVIYD
ncbi:efflux RND transporter periplasmic adaptor subunit [Legionella fairfieldensis]|uniref:efflux RND transporter periplasmic adaptor subunit n=1 Tax=Legionella fairfieldensis TaxID=45064 RepID=UPI00048D5E29|nr:efflux RND transporter periplasmic adaptor subunit [Legionella fairfieldensis]